MSAPGYVARPYEPGDRSAWDALAAVARARHFTFQRAYLEYHADRFTDASLVVERGGRAVALLPASRDGTTVTSHGGLTFGGLLSGPDLTVARTTRALEAALETLRATGARRLVVKPVPHIYHLGAAEEDLYALHDLGARLIRRDLATALAPGVRFGFASSRRAVIDRARDSGEIRVAPENEAIEEYMELVADVLRDRHDAIPTHTPDEMRGLAEAFPDQIRLFTAREAGTLLAGVLVYETPAVAHTQYIATSPRGRTVGAGDLTIAHLIEERYPDRWFDFGISNERDGTLNEGLARFKEGFGGRAVLFDRYALELDS